MIKFSKPLGGIIELKKNMFEDDSHRLEELLRVADFYLKQPERKACKNCEAKLDGAKDSFVKMGIKYVFCDRCGHLNGSREDTKNFCKFLYTKDDGKNYAANYMEADKKRFNDRMAQVYAPKAEFLKQALQEQGVEPEDMTLSDFGAGAGYFLGAAKDQGFPSVVGFEPSPSMVDFGNNCLNENLLKLCGMDETAAAVRDSRSNIVSLIGALEHFQNPRDVLSAIRDNENINYVFLLLPMFSPSVVVESVFENVAPRLLVGAHTHLYTLRSISHLCSEFGFKIVSEWWFGQDAADLYRSFLVSLLKKGAGSAFLADYWRAEFKPLLDDFQSLIDRKKICSEAHLVLKVDRGLDA
ncbi:MAG TPA: class I SAM-dependent methyltransferase [bacterium]|nr:class I SAM-dependent methyltransferase [bacterium]